MSRRKRSEEEIMIVFNALRQEQRSIANKLYEMENELQEHKIVIEALKETQPDRKCYRMIGGILVEGTVKEVLPNVRTNSVKLKQVMDAMSTRLTEKGQEILAFKDKHPSVFVSTPAAGIPATTTMGGMTKIAEEAEES